MDIHNLKTQLEAKVKVKLFNVFFYQVKLKDVPTSGLNLLKYLICGFKE